LALYIYSFFVDQSTHEFVPDLVFLVDSGRFELPREQVISDVDVKSLVRSNRREMRSFTDSNKF